MRAAIYARVSSDEQLQGFSIAAQLRACRDYAASHDYTLAAEYVDEGLSAKSADIRKRPQFQQMMAAAAAHKFEVVLVHKLDRFSRNLRLLLDCFSKLADAGVELVSLSDRTAYRTPSDKLSVHVLASVAEFFSSNLGTEVAKGKAERKRQGLYNGWLPFGTVKDADGVPAPDERPLVNGATNHDGLLLAFRLCAQGRSTRQIAGALNAGGWRSAGRPDHRPFSSGTVNVILRNRFYTGELPVFAKGEQRKHRAWSPAKHAPLVPADLFAEVQATLDYRANHQRIISTRHSRRRYSLTGLLVCGECGQPIHIEVGGRKWPVVSPKAVCASRATKGIYCSQPGARLSVYEEALAAWFAEIVLTPGILARAHAQMAQDIAPVDVARERARLGGQLERLRELRLLGDVELAEYVRRRDALLDQLTLLKPVKKQQLMESYAKLIDICSCWHDSPPEKQNETAAAVIEAITVRDGRIVEIRMRPEFRPFVGNVPALSELGRHVP